MSFCAQGGRELGEGGGNLKMKFAAESLLSPLLQTLLDAAIFPSVGKGQLQETELLPVAWQSQERETESIASYAVPCADLLAIRLPQKAVWQSLIFSEVQGLQGNSLRSSHSSKNLGSAEA